MKVSLGPISIALGMLSLACGKSATGPAQGPTGGLPPAAIGDELVVTAETRAWGVPVQLWTVMTLRNASDEALAVVVSGSCPVVLRAYRTADRAGRPAWDGDRLDRCAPEIARVHRLSPGDSVQEFFETGEAEILGDSLPPGRYHFSALLRGSSDLRPEIPTIDVEMSGARLIDVEVPRAQTVTVPGTGLEITLQDVTDDQRCPLRDQDGNPIVCVWQGNADLNLGLSAPGLEPETRVLRSGFDPLVEYGPFRIAFFGLTPERSLDVVIDPADYVAILRVTVPPSTLRVGRPAGTTAGGEGR